MKNRDAERSRLYTLVDRFLDKLEDEGLTEPRIDTAMVFAIVEGDFDDGVVSGPFAFCESSRPHVQLGMHLQALNSLLLPSTPLDT